MEISSLFQAPFESTRNVGPRTSVAHPGTTCTKLPFKPDLNAIHHRKQNKNNSRRHPSAKKNFPPEPLLQVKFRPRKLLKDDHIEEEIEARRRLSPRERGTGISDPFIRTAITKLPEPSPFRRNRRGEGYPIPSLHVFESPTERVGARSSPAPLLPDLLLEPSSPLRANRREEDDEGEAIAGFLEDKLAATRQQHEADQQQLQMVEAMKAELIKQLQSFDGGGVDGPSAAIIAGKMEFEKSKESGGRDKAVRSWLRNTH